MSRVAVRRQASLAWSARQLTVRYGGSTVLEGVDLEGAAGTVTVVAGGDGAGKSTLLKAVLGLVPTASGEVRRPALERIGAMAEVPGVWADMTVDEHLRFTADAYGLRPRAWHDHAGRLLARAGLDDARDRLAAELSGGMRQKLAVVLALLHEPEVLLLDEPTTGVDPVSRAELWRLIGHEAAAGTSVLMSTTYLDEAERAAHVLVLDRGRPILQGPPEDLAESGHLEEAVVAAQRRAEDGRSGRRTATTRPSAGPDGPTTGRAAAADHVSRSFGTVRAVRDVSLHVEEGEVVGLVGANGAGKTTLIRLLLGLLAPDAGAVELAGGPPGRATRRRVGYVPQSLGLWTDLSISQHLQLSRDVYGGTGSVADPLDTALRGRSDVAVGDLPLGLRRRAAFAMALAHRPRVVVLDEPTSGVDPLARSRLWETVRAVAQAGAGVLVSTHYLGEAERCDRTVLMASGAVVADGTVSELTAGRTAVEVSCDDWQGAWRRLEQGGLTVLPAARRLRVVDGDVEEVRRVLEGFEARVATVAATLEEVFWQLTA